MLHVFNTIGPIFVIILLASPTATLTYIMAGEMEGSTELATAAISLNTLLSAITFVFWLGFRY